ncbi:MAG: aminotransferase class III-fold pyridoxal phosphate-dependent enzyme [Cyclobacteriaceae bacterium]|nr:aminotransferase class III-fold pyridoxal phosphate-dependent enzyme [Cyclobacteriaceae bacterium]
MEKKIIEFLQAKYGFDATLEELRGYDDLNYLLTIDGKAAYVLKLSRDISQRSFLESQHKIINILAHLNDFQFPRVIPDKTGNHITSFEEIFTARILTYIPGEFIAEVPKNDELSMNFGKFLGRVDSTLLGHRNPVIESRHNPWDIRTFPELRNKLDQLQDAGLKKLIHYFIIQYEMYIGSCRGDIRKSVIHNDANDWNVLVEGNNIRGLIDFGDLAYTYTVNELAIAATYMAMDRQDPVSGILPLIQGYHQAFPLNETEISMLYYLIAARLGISLIMSDLSEQQDPGNSYIGIHVEKACSLIEKWISINPRKAEDQFRGACGWPSRAAGKVTTYSSERSKYFSKVLSLSYQVPIVMEKAAFQYMYGDHGRTYVDCVNNIMHVGHAHPVVVEAGQRQMAILNTNSRYYYDALSNYAGRLLELFPAHLNKVFLVNSGSAASDLAIRLARNFTGRKDIIVMEHGYHGNTTTGIEISHYKFAGKGGSGAEKHIHVAPIPDLYRGEFRKDDSKAGIHYAEKINPFLSQPVAGFICEPIVGCGGQIVLPPGYLDAVYKKVRHAGGVCIADEVQTGFGRAGSHFWAFEMQGVIPDIVILGKPMGNGHPLGAVVCTGEIASAFENGMEFFSSFGGNPVSCEIGSAVLNVIRAEELQKQAENVGNFLLKEFSSLQARYPVIGDVRGSGFFLGLELVSDPQSLAPATDFAKKLINKMKDAGFLLSTDGPYNQVIKFKPPMCFSITNAADLVLTLESTLNSAG